MIFLFMQLLIQPKTYWKFSQRIIFSNHKFLEPLPGYALKKRFITLTLFIQSHNAKIPKTYFKLFWLRSIRDV